MKKKITIILILGALFVLLAATTRARDGGRFNTRLTGFEEVPVISTTGTGTFSARVVAGEDAPAIEYELNYSGLQNVFAAHVHFGQLSVNGGVSAFLCGGGDKPACPPSSGQVTGTIDMADVVGPASQGIAPGEIGELITAMQEGVAYVNVHTNDGMDPPNTGPGDFPGGEIRGQMDD
jgi:hypothetical protein